MVVMVIPLLERLLTLLSVQAADASMGRYAKGRAKANTAIGLCSHR